MKNDIVLIYPNVGDQKIISGVPHSILAVNESIKNCGYNIELIDQKKYEGNFEVIFASSRIAGFSVMTGPQIKYALELSELAKKINPKIRIIWGGWHPTLMPETTLENEFVDYIFMGETGERFRSFLKFVMKDVCPENISGIGYKKNKKIILNNYIPALEKTKDFIDYLNYDLSFYSNNKILDLITSYGCPFFCSFCAQTSVYGCSWKGLSAEKLFSIIIEISNKYEVYEFEFVDTNFFIQKKRVLNFSKLLKKSGLKIKWNASVRADQIIDYTDDEFKLIVESGFNLAPIGFESGSEKILKIINKGEQLSDFKACIEKLRKFNIKIFGTFIIGIPGENEEDIQKTFELAGFIKNEYSSARLAFLYFTPYPGTALYKIAINAGFLPPNKLLEWSNFSHNNLNIPWLSESFKQKIDKDIMKLHTRNFIDDLADNRPIYIFGTSLSSQIAYDLLSDKNKKVFSFVETSPIKQNFNNITVISLDEFLKSAGAQIILATYGYQNEIEKIIIAANKNIKTVKLYQDTIFYI